MRGNRADFWDRHRTTIWWFGVLCTPGLFTGLSLWHLVHGNWELAINGFIFVIASCVWIHTSIVTFQWGYRRGMNDLSEAMLRAESQDELLRLTSRVPKPWQ
jgi:hypothetical protein